MSAQPATGSVRFGAPALLIVGVCAAALLFVHGQPARPWPGGPGGGSPNGAAPMGASPATAVSQSATAAHAAAGVSAGPEVARAFEDRVHALRARLEAEDGGRDLHVEFARLLHDGHRTREAVEHYRKAIEIDPSEPSAYYDLAQAYGELGEWELAADVLQDRLDRDGGDAVARYDLGAVRANQGRMEEAARLFEEARTATSDGSLRARISEALARLKRP